MTEHLAEVLAQMALELHEHETVDGALHEVLEHALRTVACRHAGVIVVRGGSSVQTVVATDAVVEKIDRAQVDAGEGPDLDVLADRSSVVVEDTLTEARWPRWAQVAADVGVRSMLGVRLHTSTAVIGSLNLYDEQPGRFAAADRDAALLLARHAAVAVSSVTGRAHLWRAIDSRQVIGQAQGILMERFDLDGEQAFAVLRRYSQVHNTKLHEVAARLVATRELPGG